MTEVEVTAAQAALAALPSSWVSPEFSATILKRASLQAVHRMVCERVAAATEAANAAVTALVSQDPSDAALSEVVATQATLTAINDVRAILPPVSIDASACSQAVAVASHAMASAVPPSPVPLDYLVELAQWRNLTSSGARRDAPVATDADRAAQASWSEADMLVKQWQSGASMWRSMDPASNDVLSTLGAAQSYIDRAATVADAVEAANKVTSEANAARRDAGLNWSPS
jgi:hypothetical protein